MEYAKTALLSDQSQRAYLQFLKANSLTSLGIDQNWLKTQTQNLPRLPRMPESDGEEEDDYEGDVRSTFQWTNLAK